MLFRSPEAAISRQDMAVILKRAFDCINIIASADSEAVVFKDTADIAPYAYESVMALSAIAVLRGNQDGEFLPKNFSTRAEAAVAVYRAMSFGR